MPITCESLAEPGLHFDATTKEPDLFPLFSDPPVDASSLAAPSRAALRDCAFLFDASATATASAWSARVEAAQRVGGAGVEQTYGEIDPVGFLALLDALPLAPGSTFVDLGCGLGKAVILAAAARPDAIRAARGIEIAEPLHAASLELLATTRARLGARVADRVTLVCGDIRDSSNWPDGTESIVAFLYWSTWPEELRCSVARRVVAETAPGALVVVSRFSLPFPEVACFELVERRWVDFEKCAGETVSVYRRHGSGGERL